MNGSAEQSIERLSVHYWQNRRLVTKTSNKGLIVMAYSLRHKHNVKRPELERLYEQIGGSRRLTEIDRRQVGRYVRETYKLLGRTERMLLKPRYVKLGYALWSHGYAVWSYTKYLRSVNHLVYCYDLTHLGQKEIFEAIRKIKKEPYKRNDGGRTERYPYERFIGR